MLGEKPVAHVLDPVAAFLKDEPDAVVTLIFECYVPSRDVVTAIRDAGLEPYCVALEENGQWPTLGAMRKSGKRLVVMSDRVDPDPELPAWLMKVWDHAWETDWQASSVDALRTRMPRRGDQENELFILNHFVTTVLGASKAAAKRANDAVFVRQRAAAAWQSFGQRPNFLVVDFYDAGDPGRAVAAINRAKDAQQFAAAALDGAGEDRQTKDGN
ncbi:hypothetical protein G3M56_008460 [Sulfuriroseicoccus oceanibius]|uniref:Uncharacterized protein n=2 Tax=Sulfuriroseicoccus oceanibius TaxID=2707525 RepID=A0A7T7JB64_9BACT|nr:hypothetical protein G3M56_008460 [Sulfuriroseicoccus oceanibius]